MADDEHSTSPPEPAPAAPSVSEGHVANVRFTNDLLDTEIAQRNARKDAQESTARWIILTSGAILTLLLSLANGAGVFEADTSLWVRCLFAATLVAGAAAALAGVGTLWPRKYDRIGKEAMARFKTMAFLDQPEHELLGKIVATRVGIAATMDDNHEAKAKWLKWSFRFLVLAFVVLAAQGAALAIDPPAQGPTAATSRLSIPPAGSAAGSRAPADGSAPPAGPDSSSTKPDAVSAAPASTTASGPSGAGSKITPPAQQQTSP